MSAPKHLSFSSLASYDDCALSWKAKYLDKVPEAPSDSLSVGLLTHDAAEGIVRYCEETSVEMIPFEIAADIVGQAFVTNDQTRTTALFSDVMIAAKTFARNYRHRIGVVLELEQYIEAVIDPSIPKLVGRLDQVTKEEDELGEFIGDTDLKTGWAMETTDRNEFQKMLQALLLKLAYPDYRVKVRNWFIRAGGPQDWHEPKDYELDNAKRRAIAIYLRRQESFATRTWLPTAGAHCSWCAIAIRCEHLQKLRDQGTAIVNLEDAQKAILEAHILDAALKARKNALKKYVDLSGPVFVDELEASYRMPAPGLTITDKAALIERLGDEALPLIGSPDARKLKKLENDPRLAGLWEEKQGRPRFTIGKIKEGDDGEE
jgi:hypothetical protein